MFLVSLPLLSAAHTLHCLAGYFFFPSPPPTIFSSLCILKSPESLPGGCCLGPLPWQLKVISTWLTSTLDFWYPAPSCLVQEVLVLYFVFSVLYTKNALTSTQFSRYSITFLTILQFSSELSSNWGTGLPCLRPIWIYRTGQQHKASLFPYLFFCLSPFVCNCCSMVRIFHLHKSGPSTLAPLCHHSSRTLTSLVSSTCLPLLGHVECHC